MTQDKTPELKVTDLAMLCARLARKCTDEKLKSQAVDYLNRHKLLSPLRDERPAEAQEQKGDVVSESQYTNEAVAWARNKIVEPYAGQPDWQRVETQHLKHLVYAVNRMDKPTPEPQGAEVAEAERNVRSDIKDGRWPSKIDIETIIRATRQQDGRVDALVKALENTLKELWEERHSHCSREQFEREFFEEFASLRAFKGE